MPIEIRELNIKVTVSQDEEGDNSLLQNSKKKKEVQDHIIATCVEQVMEILKEKLER